MDKVLVRQPMVEPQRTVTQVWASWFDQLVGELAELKARPAGEAPSGDVLAALAGKADQKHTHTIAEIAGLSAALGGKEPLGISHMGMAPPGGATGTVLKKLTDIDYDYSWGVDNDTGGSGGVADGDKGDVTVSGAGTVWTIDNGVVNTAKMGGDVTAAGKALLDDATAAAQRTTLGLGALATKATVATADLDNDAVTYAKLQNVSAADMLLGRATAGAGDAEEIPCTAAGRALLDDGDATTQRTTLGLGSSAVLNVPAAGDAAAGEVVKGSDTRLTNARAPTAHTHTLADITDEGALAAKNTIATGDIDANAVTNAKLATMATKTYKGRTAGTTGDPEDVAVATLKADLALAKGDVGLGNVDNTSDVNKPVSTAQQTALNLKAPIASPSFTGATLTLADAQDVVINATTGSKIGQGTSKVGFFGVAPVVRPTALTQTYATASATHPAVTAAQTQLAAPAGGVGVAAGGWSTAANRDLAITSINAARTDITNLTTDIANLKKFVNQIVDQLQALGLLQ